MVRSKPFALALAICFSLVCGLAIAGDKSDSPKPLKPHKALQKLTKNFVKAKSYHTTCDVVGGISRSEKHDVSEVTVTERYKGDFYRNVMHVPTVNAYRTARTKGAIRSGGLWYQLMALGKGSRMDGLFPMPQEILSTALKSAEKIEWIYVGDEQDVEVKKEGKKAKKGSTTVAKDESSKVRGLPHVLRVTLPEKVSLKQWVQVENSGCASGG